MTLTFTNVLLYVADSSYLKTVVQLCAGSSALLATLEHNKDDFK